MIKLKPCPKCGYPEGLTHCPQCHAEYEKDPWVPRKPAAVFEATMMSTAQEQLFSHFGRPQHVTIMDESEKK